jgi:DNA-binding response OmpR family regulator
VDHLAYYPKRPDVIKEKKENPVAVTGISTALYAYLQEHANEIVSADQLEKYFKGKYDS